MDTAARALLEGPHPSQDLPEQALIRHLATDILIEGPPEHEIVERSHIRPEEIRAGPEVTGNEPAAVILGSTIYDDTSTTELVLLHDSGIVFRLRLARDEHPSCS